MGVWGNAVPPLIYISSVIYTSMDEIRKDDDHPLDLETVKSIVYSLKGIAKSLQSINTDIYNLNNSRLMTSIDERISSLESKQGIQKPAIPEEQEPKPTPNMFGQFYERFYPKPNQSKKGGKSSSFSKTKKLRRRLIIGS